MNQARHVGILPLPFAAAVHDLSAFQWDERIHITEREPPTNIAPYAAVLEAEIIVRGEEVGSGRLILLHDPAGNQSWGGTFRCVTFAQADVSAEMVHDPFLADVGWSWLTDALKNHGADFAEEGGTITTTASTPFGTKQEEEQHAQIEIRASWTPLLDDEQSFTVHLRAWQDLLREVAGIPPESGTVIPIATRIVSRR